MTAAAIPAATFLLSLGIAVFLQGLESPQSAGFATGSPPDRRRPIAPGGSMPRSHPPIGTLTNVRGIRVDVKSVLGFVGRSADKMTRSGDSVDRTDG